MTTPTPTASQEKPTCALCCNNIDSTSTVYCGRTYHKPCLDKWFEKNVTTTENAAAPLFKGCGGTISSANIRTHGCGGSSSHSQRPRVQGCGGGNSNFDDSGCGVQ